MKDRFYNESADSESDSEEGIDLSTIELKNLFKTDNRELLNIKAELTQLEEKEWLVLFDSVLYYLHSDNFQLLFKFAKNKKIFHKEWEMSMEEFLFFKIVSCDRLWTNLAEVGEKNHPPLFTLLVREKEIRQEIIEYAFLNLSCSNEKMHQTFAINLIVAGKIPKQILGKLDNSLAYPLARGFFNDWKNDVKDGAKFISLEFLRMFIANELDPRTTPVNNIEYIQKLILILMTYTGVHRSLLFFSHPQPAIKDCIPQISRYMFLSYVKELKTEKILADNVKKILAADDAPTEPSSTI